MMSLAYVFDMLYMGVCTTRHWQMSCRMVQESNVCTLLYEDVISLTYLSAPMAVSTFSSWSLAGPKGIFSETQKKGKGVKTEENYCTPHLFCLFKVMRLAGSC